MVPVQLQILIPVPVAKEQFDVPVQTCSGRTLENFWIPLQILDFEGGPESK